MISIYILATYMRMIFVFRLSAPINMNGFNILAKDMRERCV